jgi:nucleoside-diphosphate-sugar epimerase
MNITGKRLFITGGGGFIGSRLCARLIDDNEVVIYDNGRRDALRHTDLAKHRNLTLIRGDVLDYDNVLKSMRGCQMVVHLAAIAGVDDVFNHPVLTMKVNMIGTYNVLEAALQNRMERVLDFSTSEVFGSYAFRVQEADVTSLGAVGETRWTYAVSKLATEHLAHNYGPQQVGQGAIHAFAIRALQGQDLVVHNDGAQIRAWCYVDDIVEGVVLALTRKEAIGHAFNIGNPRSVVTVYNLAREVIRVSNSTSKIRFEKVDRADVELRIPSIAKARELLGFEPKVDLEDGLRQTIEWYRRHTVAQAAG